MYLVIIIGTNVLADESKIGFVNIRKIMQNTTAGKKSEKNINKLYDEKAETIKAAENELKKMKDDLDKQDLIMTDSVRKDKEAIYQRMLREYHFLVKDTNRELKLEDDEVGSKLLPNIAKVISSIADRGKYTLIIDVSIMPVLYYDKEKDLTNKVIEEFNKSEK